VRIPISLDFLLPVSYDPEKNLRSLSSPFLDPDFAKDRAFLEGAETDITEKLSIRSGSQAAKPLPLAFAVLLRSSLGLLVG